MHGKHVKFSVYTVFPISLLAGVPQSGQYLKAWLRCRHSKCSDEVFIIAVPSCLPEKVIDNI